MDVRLPKPSSLTMTTEANQRRLCFGRGRAKQNIATTFCRAWAGPIDDATSSFCAGPSSWASSPRRRLRICSTSSASRTDGQPGFVCFYSGERTRLTCSVRRLRRTHGPIGGAPTGAAEAAALPHANRYRALYVFSVVAARVAERGLQSAGVLVSEGGFGILRTRRCSHSCGINPAPLPRS